MSPFVLILRIYLTLAHFLFIIVLKIRILIFGRIIMEKIGVIKEFDKLGRIVIPKELRERYGLDKKVEIVATPHGVLIKNPEFVLIKLEKTSDEY